jgi:hypothetical protein
MSEKQEVRFYKGNRSEFTSAVNKLLEECRVETKIKERARIADEIFEIISLNLDILDESPRFSDTVNEKIKEFYNDKNELTAAVGRKWNWITERNQHEKESSKRTYNLRSIPRKNYAEEDSSSEDEAHNSE